MNSSANAFGGNDFQAAISRICSVSYEVNLAIRRLTAVLMCGPERGIPRRVFTWRELTTFGCGTPASTLWLMIYLIVRCQPADTSGQISAIHPARRPRRVTPRLSWHCLCRSSLANGVAQCLVPHLLIDPRSLTSSLMNAGGSFAGERSPTTVARGLGWFSCFTSHQTYRTSRPGLWWNCTPIPSNAGGTAGQVVTSPWPIERAADASPLFPPRDRAIVKAIACEAVCQTKLPLSRLSTFNLADRTSVALGRSISPSTVWRILDTDAIKPWRYQYWIFPRDPKFSEKAGRVLELYAGSWEGKPLGGRDYIISSDEKTSIQARIRCHATLPTGPRRPMRVEHEYERGGALQYLAAWDVRRGRVLGR